MSDLEREILDFVGRQSELGSVGTESIVTRCARPESNGRAGVLEALDRLDRDGEVIRTPDGGWVADLTREQAYEEWVSGGGLGMGDLDLRAAAQHAQVIGDAKTERQIDSELASRGQA